MSLNQVDRQELKEIVRELVAEELARLRTEGTGKSESGEDMSDIDRLAHQIFDRYDDVFKALA